MKPKQYFKALDGLRLFASVNIVLLHIYTQRPVSYMVSVSQGFIDYIIYAPAFNASMFYLLSGFIFTYKYSEQAGKFPVKSFLLKRFKKLYPLHFATTLLMALILIFLSIQNNYINPEKIFLSLSMHLSLLWSFFPLNTYRLNLPSWSLSSFLLCYLLFPVFLKLINKITKQSKVIFYIFLSLIPGIIWTFVYSLFGFNNELFLFFHIFAPIRFFEFVIGMLIARLFRLNKGRNTAYEKTPYLNTIIILFSLCLIFLNTYFRFSSNKYIYWLAYHVFCIIPYSALIYCFAKGTGIICSFTKIKIIRKLGKISFYTYLIHFPIIYFIPLINTDYFNFSDFLFSPIKILVFLILLYGGSLLFTEKIKPVLFKNKLLNIKRPKNGR